MFAENYRSLRSIRMDLAGVNLFIGENGVGKSNLYRALQLVQAAVRGHLAREIAEEGGMVSAIWSGPQRVGKPARIRLDAELIDEERAITFRYRIEAGFRPPKAAAGFAHEPQVKEEELTIETGRRPVPVMKRIGPGIFVRGEGGRMVDYPEQAMTSETAISLLGDAGHYPEIGDFRRAVDQWRFFHGFRTDRESPLRMPCLAITAPLLDEPASTWPPSSRRFGTRDRIRSISIARLPTPLQAPVSRFLNLVNTPISPWSFLTFRTGCFRPASFRTGRCASWRWRLRFYPIAVPGSSR